MRKTLCLLLALVMLLGMAPVVHAETYTGSCGIGINWTLDTSTGVLQVRGNGDMKDCGNFGAPWNEHTKYIKSIVVEPGITAVGNYTFAHCKNLTSVSLPEGITRIGAGAFLWCDGLSGINLPQSVEIIGNDAFFCCKKLAAIVIPENVTSLGASVFQSCEKLTSVKMYEGLESVGDHAFWGCKLLKYAMLPDSVRTIGEYAFSGCSSLTAQRIGDNVEVVPWCMLNGCKALTSLYIGKNVKQIDYAPFEDCTSLKHTVLPEGLLKIGESAFRGSGLVEIVLPSTLEEIVGGAFMNCKSLKRIAVLNPNCLTRTSHTYSEGTYGVVGTTTIYGHESTSLDDWDRTAMEYADKYGFGFEFINEENLWTDYVEPAPDGQYAGFSKENPFYDIYDTNAYYYQPVLWAYKNGITSGITATTFGPAKECKRGQVVTFLHRALNKPSYSVNGLPFLDVSKLEYYYDAVCWAYENKITTGKNASHFAPEDTVTRAQFVTFLWRAAQCPKPTTRATFSDVDPNQYYYDAICWAVEEGITQGTGNNLFSPERNCKREQVVTFLYRFLNQ